MSREALDKQRVTHKSLERRAAKVRATRAGIYRGEAAVRAGLGDKVGTLEDAILALAEHLDERRAA